MNLPSGLITNNLTDPLVALGGITLGGSNITDWTQLGSVRGFSNTCGLVWTDFGGGIFGVCTNVAPPNTNFALLFDGAQNYVSIPGFANSYSNLTIEMWIKTSRTAGHASIFGVTDGSTYGLGLQYSYSGDTGWYPALTIASSTLIGIMSH